MIETIRQSSDLTYRGTIPATPTGSSPGIRSVHSFRLLSGGLMANVTNSRPQLLLDSLKWIVPRRSSARSLMKYAGTWAGDDLRERLQEVYATRGEAEF